MQPTGLRHDPIQIAIDYGLIEDSTLSISPSLQEKLSHRFAETTARMPWSNADRAFAATISQRYFEAMHLCTHIEGALRAREKEIPRTSETLLLRVRLTSEQGTAHSLYNILTADTSREAFNSMTQTGIGGKIYDTDTAIKFLGTIIRYSIESFSRVNPRLDLGIMPSYEKSDTPEKLVQDLAHTPDTLRSHVHAVLKKREADFFSGSDCIKLPTYS